jgi:hypothetical protein
VSFRPLPQLTDCVGRLDPIFPRAAFDTVLSNPLAAAAVAAMIYVDAIVPDDGTLPTQPTWARPSMCLWLSDAAYARQDDASRAAWWEAAMGGAKRVAALLERWGEQFEPRYADGARRGPARTLGRAVRATLRGWLARDAS